MDTKEIIGVLLQMRQRIEEEKDFLTELDNAIADGDHGINMAKGFSAMAEKCENMQEQSVGAVLKTAGMTVVSAVGGSAGPLYGTAFMKAGMVMGEKTNMDIADFLLCMKSAVEGVMMRGKAVRGEKTMLDAMIPALEAMEQASAGGQSPKAILESGVNAAREGVEFTKTIPATKGRASYIGQRSIGHQDPGATSFTFLLEVAANAL